MSISMTMSLGVHGHCDVQLLPNYYIVIITGIIHFLHHQTASHTYTKRKVQTYKNHLSAVTALYCLVTQSHVWVVRLYSTSGWEQNSWPVDRELRYRATRYYMAPWLYGLYYKTTVVVLWYLIIQHKCVRHVKTFHQLDIVDVAADIALQKVIGQCLVEPCSTFGDKL